MTTQYDALFDQAGKTHNVDPALLRAIAKQESGFDPIAVSPVGAEGMMQLMPATARRLGVKDAKDPAQAIDGAARLLSEAMDRNGNVEDAITEYHGGPDRKLWGPKTRKYRAEVLAAYQGGGDQPAAGGSVDDILFGDNTPKAAEAKSPVDDILFGDAPPEQASLTGGITPYAGMKETLPPEQQKTYETLVKAGMLGDADEAGSARKPFFMQSEGDVKGLDPGAYYVDRAGQLARAPGGDPDHSFGKGFGQGLADIPLSVSKMLPGTGDSELGNVLDAKQMIYDADHKGDLMSGAGRFTGQLVGSALPLGAAEAAVAPVAAASGVGRFLIGQGGKAMAPGLARLATRGASLAAEGAAQGAGGAALVSSASDAPLSEQIATGAAGGALLGLTLPAVAAAGKGAGKIVSSLTRPLSGTGQEKMVDDLLHAASGGTKLVPDTTEYVPGSVPTMGEATGNAGIAGLERVARTNPQHAEVFADRLSQNSQARRDMFDAMKGDEQTIKDLDDARDAATSGVREAAFLGAKPADPTGIVEKIDEIIKGPSGQRDVVVKALSNLKAKVNPEGAPQTDVEQLYGIRKSIDDMLSPMASNDAKGSQLASRELLAVKSEIDKAIEEAAPGFKGYLKTYADMSKPLDEARYLQSLNITDAKGNITLAKVQTALRKIDEAKKKPGVNPAKSISDDTLTKLTALRDDLLRAGNIDNGKARGSDTRQNFATDAMASSMSVPLAFGAGALAHLPLVGPGMVAGKMVYGAKNKQVAGRLASRLLDPEGASTVARPAPKQSGPASRIAGQIVKPALPVAGAMLSSRLLGQ